MTAGYSSYITEALEAALQSGKRKKRYGMNNEVYSFKIGAFECMAVADGVHTYSPPTFPPPAVFLFGNVPEQRLRDVLSHYDLQPESWTE